MSIIQTFPLSPSVDTSDCMKKDIDYVTAGHDSGLATSTRGAAATEEGFKTYAHGDNAHAEGYKTSAYGNSAHSEGAYTYAKGLYSHAEGYYTSAGDFCHTEGGGTTSGGTRYLIATASNSHAEGCCTSAMHLSSHAEGHWTKTGTNYQHVQGRYNVGKSDTLFEIGNGTADNARKNIFVVNDSGQVFASNGNTDISDYTTSSDNKLIAAGDLSSKIFKEISETDYSNLTTAEKNDPKVVYFRTGANALGYPVQNNASATDLTNGYLPTGQTIKSYLNSNYIKSVYLTGKATLPTLPSGNAGTTIGITAGHGSGSVALNTLTNYPTGKTILAVIPQDCTYTSANYVKGIIRINSGNVLIYGRPGFEYSFGVVVLYLN